MDKRIVNAYKKDCFHGRGRLARWVDRMFFSALGGLCLYILCPLPVPCFFLSLALLVGQAAWDKKSWIAYQARIREKNIQALRRESWMKTEAQSIWKAGDTILYPTPDAETFMGKCLEKGKEVRFHCFGTENRELVDVANRLGCAVIFHPWGQGEMPDGALIDERIIKKAPRMKRALLRQAMDLPASRFYIVGLVLLLLSIALRRGLYWRLLASLCFLWGSISLALSPRVNGKRASDEAL